MDVMKGDLELDCPKCGAKIECNMRQMYPGASVICDACGVRVDFAGDDMRAAADALAELNRTIEDFNKSGF